MTPTLTSTFAEIVLALSIPLSIGLFFLMRPLPAALIVAFASDMFLPEGPSYHIPFLPLFNKHNLPYVCILIGCLLRSPRTVTRLPKEKWFVVLSALALLGGAATGLTNGDAFPCGEDVLPAMTFKDGMSAAMITFVQACVTFYVGYALVRTPEALEKVLLGLAIAGLVYCPFAILEMRLSPQLHGWIYGYGLGGWEMTRRWGGYRPSAFMPHGLALARFFMGTTLALFVVAKYRRVLFGVPVRLLAWFHAVVLVLCRSTGAILLGAIGILLLTFARPKRQLLVGALLAWFTILYPLFRSVDLFPAATVLSLFGEIHEERRDSLAFRFQNEDTLLTHARQRIVFGWGTYGRNRVCDDRGRDNTTTDGQWIIILGVSGVAGFLVGFGVLVYPVLRARRVLHDYPDNKEKLQLAGLALILALQAVDLIPNALWLYYPYFLAGALARRLRDSAPAASKHMQARGPAQPS